MKKIAFWGAAHPVHARFLIAFGHLFLLLNALWLGFLLYAANVQVPQPVTGAAIVLFMAVYVLYPTKARWGRLYSFGRRKAADFVLVMATVIIVCGYYNAGWFTEDREQRLATESAIVLQVANRVREAPAKAPSLREQTKQLRKELRTALRRIKEEKPISAELKVLLVFLSVVAALWIALLVAALACNIACSGNDGLAILVLVAGWIGVIFLAVLLIRLIVRRPTKRKEKPVDEAAL